MLISQDCLLGSLVGDNVFHLKMIFPTIPGTFSEKANSKQGVGTALFIKLFPYLDL